MKTLIIYDKINSSAESLSKEILDNINCEFKRAFPVNKAKDTCLIKYDFIILGGSIKRGNIPGNLKRYVERNRKTLKGKNFALFIICYDREKRRQSYGIFCNGEERATHSAEGRTVRRSGRGN